jgi:MoaA/NifB/PqqE/SkfB family radical SAM enzyme
MSKSDSLCVIPWIGIDINPIGTARACCVSMQEIHDDNGNLFNIKDNDLETIYKSKHMQQLRQDFRQGIKPNSCQVCWEDEAAGRTSKRIRAKIRFEKIYHQIDWNNDTPDQLWFLGLKLGNICNLKCRICSPYISSELALEEIKHDKIPRNKKSHYAHQWLEQGKWPCDPNTKFWNNLKKLLSQIIYLELSGGEPWLIREHFDILKFAVSEGLSSKLVLHYETNGMQSIIPHIQLFSEFHGVEIVYSIDNIGKKYEYERHGAFWNKINKNIDDVQHLQGIWPNISIQVGITINIQNILYIDDILEWALTKNFENIFICLLHDPYYMNIGFMTTYAKNLTIKALEKSKWKNSKFGNEIKNLIECVKNGPGSDGREFVNRMKLLDNRRNENFKDTHPEIAIAMGYE